MFIYCVRRRVNNGRLAQWIAHLTSDQKVERSSRSVVTLLFFCFFCFILILSIDMWILFWFFQSCFPCGIEFLLFVSSNSGVATYLSGCHMLQLCKNTCILRYLVLSVDAVAPFGVDTILQAVYSQDINNNTVTHQLIPKISLCWPWPCAFCYYWSSFSFWYHPSEITLTLHHILQNHIPDFNLGRDS